MRIRPSLTDFVKRRSSWLRRSRKFDIGATSGTSTVAVQFARFVANALRFDRTPLTVTGWTWPETERRLAHTAFAIDEPNGDGHVVMIEGPVMFRGYWRNTERLLTNALLYAPALD